MEKTLEKTAEKTLDVRDMVPKERHPMIFDTFKALGLGESFVLVNDHDPKHASVNHTANEWVRGDVHTNNIESVWSLFKRSLIGSYHHMSVKHMQSYLEEIEWRFNNRHNDHLFRDTLRALVKSEVLT